MNVVITGGCGFIGANCALKMRETGCDVTVFDSMVHSGAQRNLAVLESNADRPRTIQIVRGDVADRWAVDAVVRDADVVIHLAAQVSVVGSLNDPLVDFRSNVVGTFNVLESARRSGRNPVVLLASTNKVYGGLERFRYQEEETRWSLPERPHGIAEGEPIELVTPYGCSKGAGDLYALDYARTFGVRTVVFRQSCIYGIHQHSTEQQGWMAWLMKAAMSNQSITIYGDGKQVRDVLHVDDLLDAYVRAIQAIDRVSGMAFNIGGGPGMTISVWCEYGEWLQDALGRRITVGRAAARSGDQRVFVSDTRHLREQLGWQPRVNVDDGFSELLQWLATTES